ncbi:MAG TPA: SRPBCC family protein [Solirubrobacterales bacterium]|nr:SRPBCC family protein [Solirubrobacterales bacterium]
MPSTGTAQVTLPSDTEILITREFDAPKELVYRAYTTPELVKRWWGGRRGNVTLAEIDLRVGGRWRYVLAANEGFEVAFNGVFREIVPGERIVNTEVYEAMPEHEAVVTVTFSEEDGRTTLSMLSDMGSKEARDGLIASGMEAGVQEGMDILEEIAAELAAGEEGS